MRLKHLAELGPPRGNSAQELYRRKKKVWLPFLGWKFAEEIDNRLLAGDAQRQFLVKRRAPMRFVPRETHILRGDGFGR
jgi:hypothetical protein